MNATDEWYDVEPQDPGTWTVVEGGLFGSQLVAGEDRALLVDAGAGIGDLRGVVEQLVDVPVTLLVTHGHWDHVGNGHQFEDVLAHPLAHDDGLIPIEPLSLTPETWAEQWLADGNQLPDGVDPDDLRIPPVRNARSVEPGETIDLGGRRLELRHIPGHAPGHLAALDREAGVLFGGDLVHMDHSLLLHFEGCDVQAAYETMERVVSLRDDGAFDTLYCSHVPPMRGEALSLLAEYRDGLAAILEGDLEYEEIDEGVPARRYAVAGNEVLTRRDVA